MSRTPNQSTTKYLGLLLVGPVVQPELQQRVVHPGRGEGLHLDHVLQEGLELPPVVGKDWDELLRVGLSAQNQPGQYMCGLIQPR